VRDRVVPTLNVRDALAAIEAKNADASIVYQTDAAISERVRVALEVPDEKTPRIVYPAALLVTAKRAARTFFDHLRSPAARAVFERSCSFS
jgi:molybdate transport system substrate-binding protein